MNALRDAALDYLDRDWSIIATNGKKPALRRWKPYQTRRATRQTVAGWFDREDVDGVAVVCGPVSGNLVCRDFDVLESYERWEASHAELATVLPTVRTPRGRHVYFTDTVSRIVTLGDGELRGNGYCLLPPSMGKYEWLVCLPDGQLPQVDPSEVGLADSMTQMFTEDTEDTEDIEAIGGCSREILESASLPAEVEKAISESLPTRVNTRNDHVLDFARALKGIPALTDGDVDSMRPYVREWHRRALAVIETKSWDETWADFVHAWRRVKYPKGFVMQKILARVESEPEPKAAERYEDGALRRLVAICWQLQRSAGRGPFFLSCRKAGELIDRSQMTAWKLLELLVHNGVLRVHTPGTKVKATRFLYVAPVESDGLGVDRHPAVV